MLLETLALVNPRIMSDFSTCNQQGEKELISKLNVKEKEPIFLPQPDDYCTLDTYILED